MGELMLSGFMTIGMAYEDKYISMLTFAQILGVELFLF